MAKGQNKLTILGTNRTGQKHGLWDFIYVTSTAKDPFYNVGDFVQLPDGRQFRYGKSGSAVITSEACYFTDIGYTAYTAFAVAAAVGDRSVTVPAATHAALTLDELRGGYINIFTGAVGDNGDNQFRGIVGNDAADANALFKVYLDAPLTSAIVASTSACETFQNPYMNLTHSTGGPMYAKVGVPAVYVSAASMYFWVQIRGPVFVNPQDGVIGVQESKGAYWRDDGAIDGANTAIGVTIGAYDSSQYAGFAMIGSASGNGPLLMLQG